MNNKLKLLIYSDCHIYGGSERLMSFLIRNQIIQQQYNITFAYRIHKIYQEGVNNEYNDTGKKDFLFPVSILSNATIFHKINLLKIPDILKKIIKFPLYFIDKVGVYFIYNLFSQIIILKKISPDIIHINNGGYPGAKSCNTMVVAAKLLHFKNIIYQVNNMARKPLNYFNKLYDSFIDKNVSCFITASEQVKVKLVKERKFNLGKIKQVPNTVIDEIPSLLREEVLETLLIKQTDFILCTVGFLSKRKGQKFLIEALHQISSNHPDIYKSIRLLLVGDGEEEQYLKEYVEELELGEHVYFLGYQKRSVDYINACDLFVLPSVADEDMPLVVLTAMSKGKIVIATDFFGIREEIEDGVSGVLVSPNIETLSESLTNKIVDLYHNRKRSFGEEAQKRFNKLFSNQVYGQSIVNIYNNVIEQN